MTLVSLRRETRVAIVTIDNPPVSLGNAALRRAMHEVLTSLEGADDIDAVVICSAQKHFYSGSDLSEFDADIAFPSLPQVIDVIDRLDSPVIAALNGLALGGGLELALACDGRVAASDTRLGLPEVRLGILPGAGGTVRLPRLVGVPRAIELIASGRPVTAQEAHLWGMVDEVVAPDRLIETALEHARTAVKRRVCLQNAPSFDETEAFEAASAHVGEKARPNLRQAVELILSGVRTDASTALQRERAAFETLRVSDEARNLRYLFFAKRRAAKDLPSSVDGTRLTDVAIVGAGTMGVKIAAAFLAAGVDVVLHDVSSHARDHAVDLLRATETERTGGGRLTVTSELSRLRPVQLVIDAVFEDAEIKRELLSRLNDLTPIDSIIASNTSYLDLDELSKALSDPSRFLGLHFFNPADRNPLLEVVRTASTGDAAMEMASKVARALQKSPIVAGVADGFIANRVYADYRTQAEFLVEEGASPREVDSAMNQLGVQVGPFAVADMSGLDIAWARRRRLAATRDPRERYVTIADSLCEAGRLGKKSGAGWYRYDENSPRGADDPVVDDLIRRTREALKRSPIAFVRAQIQQRILCGMLVAAAHLTREGILRRPSDIDVAMTEGFAFPAWLGGPLRYAASQPRTWVIDGLSAVHESDPIRYELADVGTTGTLPAPIATILDQIDG